MHEGDTFQHDIKESVFHFLKQVVVKGLFELTFFLFSVVFFVFENVFDEYEQF